MEELSEDLKRVIALGARHALESLAVMAATLGFRPDQWASFQASVVLTMLSTCERAAHVVGPEAVASFETALSATRDEVARQVVAQTARAEQAKANAERRERDEQSRLAGKAPTSEADQRALDALANTRPKGSA